MSENIGKKFESKVRMDWLKVRDASICRLPDVTNGFKSVSGISDFIGYIYPFEFYIECKETQGNTFPLSKLTQADKLKSEMGKLGVNAGIMLWFRTHHKVCWVPIEEYCRLQDSGFKSVNIKMLGDSEFNIYEIPGTLKRTFIDSDYSIMTKIGYEKYLKEIESRRKDER